jgi:hypothetical protein
VPEKPNLSTAKRTRRLVLKSVIAVEREAVYGVPAQISTSYTERSNLSMRMACRRFTRLTNAFSKKLDNHAAAVSLYVAHYNFCRVHESLRTTPAFAQGVADRVWSISDLLDASLATQPIDPVVTAPSRVPRSRGRQEIEPQSLAAIREARIVVSLCVCRTPAFESSDLQLPSPVPAPYDWMGIS